MSILINVLTTLTSDVKTTLITFIIAFIVYKIARFYVRVLSLPPGPIPLPFLGNILLFRRKEHWDVVFKETFKKYQGVMTLWLGSKPAIFITDKDIAREAFKKNEFSGRPESFFGQQLSNKEFSDVIMTDYGHTWEALRRVAHSAVQKYANNEQLVLLANDCVDKTFDMIIEREGFNKPIDFAPYIYYVFLNILSISAFGKEYDMKDPEYLQIKYSLNDFGREAGSRFLLWEFSPLIRLLDRKLVTKQQNLMKGLVALMRSKYKSHINSYDESVVRDFCDALISAKNDALNENKESAPYLTDDNLAMTVLDLFFAGTDTSRQTFEWILLFLLYYPKFQQKLRQEIESQIGDRMPTHEDRNRCHYAMAFISEALRLRNVASTGVFHKAVVRTELENYTIPEGMTVFVYQGAILTDEKYWSNPDQFNPDRFIENGEYMKTRSSAFIPFGVGRRVCLGEKLAIADLFIVFVRFVQKFSQYGIELHSNHGLDPDPNKSDALAPKEYKVILKKIK